MTGALIVNDKVEDDDSETDVDIKINSLVKQDMSGEKTCTEVLLQRE